MVADAFFYDHDFRQRREIVGILQVQMYGFVGPLVLNYVA